MEAFLNLFAKMISAEQIGGWTRALVAVLLGSASSWFGGVLVPFLTPDFQAAIGLVIATVVVGVWQTIAKKYNPPVSVAFPNAGPTTPSATLAPTSAPANTP